LEPLTEEQILAWADALNTRTGKWPTKTSGSVAEARGEKWSSIDNALRKGLRGLPGGSCLAGLLAKQRRVRNFQELAPLTVEQILAWADEHHARTSEWPTRKSGAVGETCDESWSAIHSALQNGRRGFAGGSSLARLLAEHRGVRNPQDLPPLTIEQILARADAHHTRTGRWPTRGSGRITEAPPETWLAVAKALANGGRGLRERLSLAKLLAEQRQVRNRTSLPCFRSRNILAWADAHHRRTGVWPTRKSGPILQMPSETWRKVDAALRYGGRGLKGGSSLARFLAEQRSKRIHKDLPPLSYKKIVRWAQAHYERSGRWPNVASGPVQDVPSEHWKLIDSALRLGLRGLRGGTSLLRLLVRKCGARDKMRPPPLGEEQILAWADLHLGRTGAWPNEDSGPIADTPGETWSSVNKALIRGKHGLPGGSSLAKLLAQKGGYFARTPRSGGELLPAERQPDQQSV
jgi:hypothetical protein